MYETSMVSLCCSMSSNSPFLKLQFYTRTFILLFPKSSTCPRHYQQYLYRFLRNVIIFCFIPTLCRLPLSLVHRPTPLSFFDCLPLYIRALTVVNFRLSITKIVPLSKGIRCFQVVHISLRLHFLSKSNSFNSSQ